MENAYGHVPHTGLLPDVNAELAEKSVGSLVILVTHQPDRFWLKLVALANISCIFVTLDVFQVVTFEELNATHPANMR